MKILLTGANGFLGNYLSSVLSKHHELIGIGRTPPQQPHRFVHFIQADLTQLPDLSDQLSDIEVIIHCAGRAHIMQEKLDSDATLAAYRALNTDATLNLARQAAQAGIQRFIFISSIKVNGESTSPGHPFTPKIMTPPTDAYGLSKFEAEEGLKIIASEAKANMDVVIIRPPLIYGPHVKANFLTMMRWLYRGLPLPLARVNNQRSMVSLANITDLISRCLTHSSASNQTFLVSDGHDVSTTELLGILGQALGKPAKLIPAPKSLLKLGGMLAGKSAMIDRLADSLQVDISHTCQALDWQPPVSFAEGIRETAEVFLQSHETEE